MRDGDRGRGAQPIALAEEKAGAIEDGSEHAQAPLLIARHQLPLAVSFVPVRESGGRTPSPGHPPAAPLTAKLFLLAAWRVSLVTSTTDARSGSVKRQRRRPERKGAELPLPD